MTSSEPPDNKSTKELIEEALGRIERHTHAGTALVSAAVIEGALEQALQNRMPGLNSEIRKRLFGSYGQLSSFASKTDVARALEIITSGTYTDLTTIRKIRNAFAHSQALLTFSSPEIRTLFTAFIGWDAKTEDYQQHYLSKIKAILTDLGPVINEVKERRP